MGERIRADAESDYAREVEEWQARLELSLRRERGWLSLVGLEWIRPGANRIGCGSDCEIVLPPGTTPDRVGLVTLDGERLLLEVQEGVEAQLEGVPIARREIQTDGTAAPDVIEVGRLSLMVIARAGRWGLRVWDRESPRRTSFPERDWYPIRSAYCLQAEIEPVTGEWIDVVNTLGDVEHRAVPGRIRFELHGVACSLAPFSIDDQGAFLAFKDLTSGAATYPGGRFLHTLPPDRGRLTIDFNRAYNPPCAFTPFATCPLPPAANQLPFEIAAGERYEPRHEV